MIIWRCYFVWYILYLLCSENLQMTYDMPSLGSSKPVLCDVAKPEGFDSRLCWSHHLIRGHKATPEPLAPVSVQQAIWNYVWMYVIHIIYIYIYILHIYILHIYYDAYNRKLIWLFWIVYCHSEPSQNSWETPCNSSMLGQVAEASIDDLEVAHMRGFHKWGYQKVDGL